MTLDAVNAGAGQRNVVPVAAMFTPQGGGEPES